MTDNQSFTVTIYCDNCRTTGDYQFPKGTRLFRETGLCRETPNWIHLDSPNGQLVRCQFCGVPNELTMLKRDEKKGTRGEPMPVVPPSDAPAVWMCHGGLFGYVSPGYYWVRFRGEITIGLYRENSSGAMVWDVIGRDEPVTDAEVQPFLPQLVRPCLKCQGSNSEAAIVTELEAKLKHLHGKCDCAYEGGLRRKDCEYIRKQTK